MQLAREWERWQNLMSAILNFRILSGAGIILTNSETSSLWWWCLLRSVYWPRTVPWLRWPVVDIPPQRTGFSLVAIHVGYVVDEKARGLFFLPASRCSVGPVLPSYLLSEDGNSPIWGSKTKRLLSHSRYTVTYLIPYHISSLVAAHSSLIKYI